ncbi:DUF896 domain-containing protein [Heyndrickxia oleronia]|uniref:UPF0291 protein BWZ43_17630 n=1 Tax=Heyndrickxia oleronia TaxID=38875 RepID=A0A8E2I5G9_9BACI|nr:DUF896 domain-containing protein [Heyndrickxia oleronia]MEC1375334.1 DUF896 domain-containing protein [Heyndrickxia oleronia]OOP67076.1 hypothetical protein BWZ43_17630 [Heyndrickxia oleronia]QQZ03103.1 DUF896 domain-containing protein [Heyndrickxia oleronia]
MLSKEKIARINLLSKKAKGQGLTEDEAKEQSRLRREYLESFRSSMKSTIETVRVIDPNGNDVTPQKVRDVQDRKRLH